MPSVKKTAGRSNTSNTLMKKTTATNAAVSRSDAEKAKQRALAEQRRRKLEQQRKAERKKQSAYYGAILILSLIGFALFLIIFIGALVLDFHHTPSYPQYTLTLNETETDTVDGTKAGKTTHTSYSVTERDGIPFVSLDDMAKCFSLLPTGDAVVRTLHFADGSTASFYVGTPYVLVGGQSVTLNASSCLTSDGGSDVLVPYEFFTRFVSGVTFSEEHRGKKIAYGMSIDGDVKLITAPNVPLDRPIGNGSGEVGSYLTDVAAYEAYIDPDDADTYLTLVNHTHPVPNAVPNDLVNVADTRYDRAPVQLRICAAKALEALFLELRANGYLDVSVTEGYVSYDAQAKLYASIFADYRQEYDDAEAQNRTRARVAEAGCGENILGLSADIHNLPSASQAFEAEAAYKWLYANCAEFGFVLRYPKNKSEITGFAFEPYHFRFVGRTHARRMMASGECLEEYVESLAAQTAAD